LRWKYTKKIKYLVKPLSVKVELSTIEKEILSKIKLAAAVACCGSEQVPKKRLFGWLGWKKKRN
jgi:hypothetical protein